MTEPATDGFDWRVVESLQAAPQTEAVADLPQSRRTNEAESSAWLILLSEAN